MSVLSLPIPVGLYYITQRLRSLIKCGRIAEGDLMKRRDYLIILALLALALIAQGLIHMHRAPAASAVVAVSGVICGKMPIEKNTVFRGQGAQGPYELEIEGGAARMVSSSCKDQLCVKQGAIRMSGQTIVCLPNEVSVRLEGDADGGMDAVTR